MKTKLNVILFEPEIAVNTGNIIRTCVGFDCHLHLIRPYGFFLNDKKLIRSATNHLDDKKISEYDDWNDFLEKNQIKNEQIFLYTKKGRKTPDVFKYTQIKEEIYLMFGKESSGIPDSILNKFKTQWVRIPMTKSMVSLNVANTVAIAVYEVLKQFEYFHLLKQLEK